MFTDNRYRQIIWILFLQVFTGSIFGQQLLTEEDLKGDKIEITEFIFNETMTKIGSDFYDYFFQSWKNPTSQKELSIHIKEKPVPGMATRITITIEEQDVYIGFIRPGDEKIQEEATDAVSRCQSYFINYEMIRKQLSSEDMTGSGIL